MAGSIEPFWYGQAVLETSSDAIIVLGARIQPDGSPGPAARRRVERAARLLEEGVAPVIVATGGRRWHGHIEALRMRRLLLDLGVPDRAIVLETFARTTAENALFSTRIARLEGWKRLTVVTCPWHLPRAVADFGLCGFSVDAAPATSAASAESILSAAMWRVDRTAKERICVLLDFMRLRTRSRR